MNSNKQKLIATTAKSYALDAVNTSDKSRQQSGARAKTSVKSGSGTEYLSSTWECGHPKSTGNAFDWKRNVQAEAKPTFQAKRGPKGRNGKTTSEMKTHATRVNKFDPITTKSTFDFDAKQKLVRASI